MYLFVYGTLKQGEPNHQKIKSGENGYAQFICPGKTLERYPLIIASKFDVPFLLDAKSIGKHIQGEVYRIDTKMLEMLDKVEQCPEIYSRRLEWIHLQLSPIKESKIQAWVYFFHNFNPCLLQKFFLESYKCDDPSKLPEHLGDKERSEILGFLRDNNNK